MLSVAAVGIRNPDFRGTHNRRIFYHVNDPPVGRPGDSAVLSPAEGADIADRQFDRACGIAFGRDPKIIISRHLYGRELTPVRRQTQGAVDIQIVSDPAGRAVGERKRPDLRDCGVLILRDHDQAAHVREPFDTSNKLPWLRRQRLLLAVLDAHGQQTITGADSVHRAGDQLAVRRPRRARVGHRGEKVGRLARRDFALAAAVRVGDEDAALAGVRITAADEGEALAVG